MKPGTAQKEAESFFAQKWTVADIMDFHSRHRYLLLSHAPDKHKEMSDLIASASYIDADSLKRSYLGKFTEALKAAATIGRNTSVMDQIFKVLKEKMSDDESKELRTLIEQYRKKEVELNQPHNLIRKLVKKHNVDSLSKQSYLER